jgi:hypothetical protein
MPKVPFDPSQLGGSASASGPMPTNPLNFLMAAAEMHKGGKLQQSAPVPTGNPLQTGKVSHSRKQMKVVK